MGTIKRFPSTNNDLNKVILNHSAMVFGVRAQSSTLAVNPAACHFASICHCLRNLSSGRWLELSHRNVNVACFCLDLHWILNRPHSCSIIQSENFQFLKASLNFRIVMGDNIFCKFISMHFFFFQVPRAGKVFVDVSSWYVLSLLEIILKDKKSVCGGMRVFMK